MELVTNVRELKENFKTLDGYLEGRTDPTYGYALDRIKKGLCFIAVSQDDGSYRFYPSRFIGYVGNTMDSHESNEFRDGRETNPAISEILGCQPEQNTKLNVEYRKYCESLGFKAMEKCPFGKERKFWLMK